MVTNMNRAIKWKHLHPIRTKRTNQKYRENHRQEIRERHKKWRDSHPLTIIKRNKKYLKLHPIKRKHTTEKYRRTHKEAVKASWIRHRDKIRKIVYNHYGNKCACCSENNPKFLTIDHINGGGSKHLHSIHMNIKEWLVRNDFPEGFQILCWNCNLGRAKNNEICPHKEQKVMN